VKSRKQNTVVTLSDSFRKSCHSAKFILTRSTDRAPTGLVWLQSIKSWRWRSTASAIPSELPRTSPSMHWRRQYICCYFTLELDEVSQRPLMSNIFSILRTTRLRVFVSFYACHSKKIISCPSWRPIRSTPLLSCGLEFLRLYSRTDGGATVSASKMKYIHTYIQYIRTNLCSAKIVRTNLRRLHRMTRR